MDIEFTGNAWEDFIHWLENDPDIVRKIKELISEIRLQPFNGRGKPEALKHDLKGFWSRRITGEHRLVYAISGKKGMDQKCTIIQCRYHYDSY